MYIYFSITDTEDGTYQSFIKLIFSMEVYIELNTA